MDEAADEAETEVHLQPMTGRLSDQPELNSVQAFSLFRHALRKNGDTLSQGYKFDPFDFSSITFHHLFR